MIVAAAIRTRQGEVFSVLRPGRHPDVFKLMAVAGVKPQDRGVQGFLTDAGVFVTREEALVIAEAAGQIVQKHAPKSKLVSEDMW